MSSFHFFACSLSTLCSNCLEYLSKTSNVVINVILEQFIFILFFLRCCLANISYEVALPAVKKFMILFYALILILIVTVIIITAITIILRVRVLLCF